MFPSPCGVKVVANPANDNRQPFSIPEFPSPCGVKVVANANLLALFVYRYK